MAGVIVGGWDPVCGGTVYNIPVGGACIPMPFALGGSGSTFIYGLVDAEYRENMTKDEALALVKKAAIIKTFCCFVAFCDLTLRAK